MLTITEIRIGSLPRKIQISGRRRPVYYTKGSKIPKRYKNPKFGKFNRLLDDEGNFVMKNKRSVDKPRYWTVSGNSFYSGTVNHHTRKKATSFFKEFFGGYLKKEADRIKGYVNDGYRLKFTLLVYYHSDSVAFVQDPDNHWIYLKWLHDAVQNVGIVPNDNCEYIYSSGEVVPVLTTNDQLVGSALIRVEAL